MRRIHDAYLSAELDKALLDTLVLFHLLILLPSEKVKSRLVEKMRLEPNINSLDEVGAYIQSQELDYVARNGTQEKANIVNQVKQQEDESKDLPKKEFTC